MPPKGRVHVSQHPGSSAQEIQNEPDWHAGHNHRIGYCNKDNRHPGYAPNGDHWETEEDKKFAEEAMRKYRALSEREDRGELVNFQDVAKEETVGSLIGRLIKRIY
jgi:nitrate reductase (NAD(P)H)